MPIYVIVDNEVHNPDAYRDYLARVTPTVAQYGGSYVVRAGKIHHADSDWSPERLVIMAFPTLEQAEAWVQDPEMLPIHAQRRANATSRLIIIDGIDQSGGPTLAAGDSDAPVE